MGSALVLGAFASLCPDRAEAHFTLEEPASWMSQDLFGSPQKLGPCGNEGGGTPTGTVTTFQTGQTITVTIHEIIFHPGHYRIALARTDRSELPAEPVVTPAATPCGSVPIESTPTFPVLADGVFLHTAPFSGPQSVQITLPPGVTCTHCTLQVIEFMSDHPLNNPGGCFYHHCADLAIQTASTDGGTADASVSTDVPVPVPVVDAGESHDAGTVGSSSAGCTCTVYRGQPSLALRFGSLMAAVLLLRRRRPGVTAVGSVG